MIALEQVPGWWQVEEGTAQNYPMDYYAKDGGSWNSVWQPKVPAKRASHLRTQQQTAFPPA